MLIIPVLDISRGQVVQAIKGERKYYKTISSTLSENSEPASVINAFLELYPFKIIYIADLDAIQGSNNQHTLINNLAQQFKDCCFWVDSGLETVKNKQRYYQTDNIELIIGSEHQASKASLATLINQHPDILLSLDFNDSGLIENTYLLRDTNIWPRRLIVMMLHRVGLNKGIDEQHLNKVLSLSEEHEVYAAGGVRGIEDLENLKTSGVKGALIGTALHNGSITKEHLTAFAKP